MICQEKDYCFVINTQIGFERKDFEAENKDWSARSKNAFIQRKRVPRVLSAKNRLPFNEVFINFSYFISFEEPSVLLIWTICYFSFYLWKAVSLYIFATFFIRFSIVYLSIIFFHNSFQKHPIWDGCSDGNAIFSFAWISMWFCLTFCNKMKINRWRKFWHAIHAKVSCMFIVQSTKAIIQRHFSCFIFEGTCSVWIVVI